jgi:hypothetical protein
MTNLDDFAKMNEVMAARFGDGRHRNIEAVNTR